MTKVPMTNKLLEGPIATSLFALAVPIVLANILQAGYQLIDAFWVGRLGGVAVAAVSVTIPITFLTIALGVGLAVAGSTLIAQYFGAKNHEMVDHVAAQTLLMIVIVSVVLGAIGYILTPWILHLMGVAPDVFEGAVGFMRVSFVGLVFNFFFFMFQSIMRGIGEAKLPVYIVLGTVILNFILDPLFIFGWGPILPMGVMGAAVATVGTQSIAALIGLVVLLRGKYGIHLSLRDFKPDFPFIKRAFSLGFPASIEQSARALGMTALTFLIASFGTLTVASYGVGSSLLQLVMIPAMGLSMAIATLVGQNIGAGNIKRAEDIGRFGTWLGFGILTAFGIIVFIFAPYFIKFFVPDDELVIASGATFLRIISLSWGFMAVQLSLTGVLRASGNMMAPMVLALVSQWVLQFPLSYILSRHTSLGAHGLWWSFTITNVVIALVTLIWYKRGDWKKTKLTTDEERLTTEVSEEILVEEGVRQ
jgi:putative MATE family efflux protein